MAFADLDAYLAAVQEQVGSQFNCAYENQSNPNGQFSQWLRHGGSAPSTAATCGRSTVGNLLSDKIHPVADAPQYFSDFRAQVEHTPKSQIVNGIMGVPTFVLCDRLSHQGGLVGNSASAQTTNLPTAALTRHTSGQGVMMAVEFYTHIGNSLITGATVSYTNQDGTSGRTSPAFLVGDNSTMWGQEGTFTPIPFQAGDTGVRSVESLTLGSAGSEAGNFGITLFRPVAIIPIPSRLIPMTRLNNLLDGAVNMIDIDDSCLFLIEMNTFQALSGDSTRNLFGEIYTIRE